MSLIFWLWSLWICVPPLLQEERDWRLFTELNPYATHFVGEPEDFQVWETVCYEPAEYPYPCYMYFFPPTGYVLYRVEMVVVNSWGGWEIKPLNSSRLRGNMWRAHVGDFDHDRNEEDGTFLKLRVRYVPKNSVYSRYEP